MDTLAPRRVIDVRSTDRGLVVSAATAGAAELVGTPHDSLLGAAWGPQFAPADHQSIVARSTEVLDRSRAAWAGDLTLAHGEDTRVHVSITRPGGSWSPRIKIQMTELRDTDRGASAGHAQDRFISSVSHELRTPLTSVLGYTHLLLDGSVGDLTPLQHRMVQRVESNGHRLLGLIENLLTLSDLETGSFCLVRRPVDLAGVVGDSLARTAPALEAGGLALAVTVGDRQCVTVGDESQLGRVVTCLLDNAVRYSRPGDQVRVDLQPEDDELVLEVADTGIGIAPEQQERLFQRFARTPDACTREDQGLGLGLAVVRSIVSSHGGRVSLASALGVGTTVTVRLPLAS